jgi:DNA-binding beta-propeller fold protein YncE
MRRYPGLARASAAIALAVAAATACGGGSTPAPSPQACASPKASSGEPSTLPLAGPVGLAQAADGTVWAAWAGSDMIAPVTDDGTAGPGVEVGDTPLRIAELGGFLWVTTIRDGTVHQVDSQLGTVVRSVELGGEPEGLTGLDGHLYVVLQADAALAEVDPADGSVVRRYRVGGEPRLVVPGDGVLYVGDFAAGRVVRVTPGEGPAPLRSKPVCAGVQDLQLLGGSLWAACMTDGAVVELDPATLRVRGRIPVEGDPDGLAPGPGADLLVSLQQGPGLAVLDTATGQVERALTATSGPLYDQANNDVLERDGTAFVSNFLGNRVEIVRLPE